MTRVLVTGATGFVGRALVPRLLAAGYQVRAVLRRPAVLPAGIEPVVGFDLEQAPDWRPALEGVDRVVHLAARVHVMAETAPGGAERYHRLNVESTRRLAEAAAAAGVRRLLLMSSVKALGESGRFSATTIPAPVDPYGRSKLEAETVLRAVAEASGALEWLALRPPLVYGPGVGANFARLIRLAGSGLPLPLAGIANRRSLIFVGNLADAVVHGLAHPAAAGRAFLVQDGEPLAVPVLIRRLARLLGRPARLFTLPPGLLRRGFSAVGAAAAWQRLAGTLEVDDRAWRATTGWTPPFTIDQGLAATVAAYRQGPNRVRPGR